MKPKILTLPDSCGACMWGYWVVVRSPISTDGQRDMIECRHDDGKGVNAMWDAPPDWCPLRKEIKEQTP